MSGTASREERWRPNPRVRMRALADEAVLLDLDSGNYYGLNATGRRIWELLSDGLTVSAAVTAMEAELEVSRETLGADVDAVLAELERAGLLVRKD